MTTKIILHEMGEGVIEGTVSRWLKRPGDAVAKYEPVLEIETDKVTTEVTAEESGILLEILVAEGQTVPVGTVLGLVGQPENGKQAQPTAVAPTAPTTPPSQPPDTAYTGRISPVVGRMAAEHNLDLSRIPGTGKDGRITKNDVLAYLEALAKQPAAEAGSAPMPAVPAAPAAPTPPAVPTAPAAVAAPAAPAPKTAVGDVLEPLTNIRRAIAEHMVHSRRTSPHVSTFFEFDFTAVSAHRAAHKARFAQDGVNLTFTAYLVAAVAEALKQHPLVNSVWTDEGILLKKEINIGMATAVDDGLIVPVIKNADSLSLLGIARAVNDLAERARRKQLKPADVQGSTFSITNHGVSGSLFATPIINQPNCGILSVGTIEKRVKVINDAIAIRPLAYVGFTFDHRILDGAKADYFVGTIKQVIENWG